MTSLLLSLLTVAALGVESPAAGAPPSKPGKEPATVAVKTFVVGGDGKLDVLDDQGIAWVHSDSGSAEALELLAMLGPRRYIGVQLITLTPELRRHFGIPEDRGVMVSRVLADTPAARAGVEVGDVLVTADGKAIDTAGDVTRVLAGKKVGDEVRIDLWRDGARMGLPVAFEERETSMLELGSRQNAPHTMLLHDQGQVPVNVQQLADKTIALRAVRQEEIDDAMRALDEYFQSAEWQERLRQLKNLDLDQVQQRMKTLERRLQELERQLAEKRR